jgi:hypothetical protein
MRTTDANKDLRTARVAIPTIEVGEKSDFKSVFVTGVYGGLDPGDGRMIVYQARLKPKPDEDRPGELKVGKWLFELQAELHMSPATFKSFAKWMAENVDRYEKTFGPIPDKPVDLKQQSPEKVEGYR